MSKRVLVTGATGFVGSALCEALAQRGHHVRAAVRAAHRGHAGLDTVVVGDIGSQTDWTSALQGVEVVMHVAARAHVLHDSPANAGLYVETNVHGTRRLAQAAANAGVRRFIFMSSIKVNGEDSGAGLYGPDDPPQPRDSYGVSKSMAEQSLREVASQTGMEATCVRGPLVYGPGVRANFLRLLAWVDKERPLPLGAIHNRRSLVSLWNLCSLLTHLVEHSAAAGRTWMVCDGEDLSTPQLIRGIARAMSRRARLLPVPVGLLSLAGAMIGRRDEIARLCGSLAIDMTRTRQELGWSPPLTVEDGLKRTVEWYLREGRTRAT